jgi:hypothetical protein
MSRFLATDETVPLDRLVNRNLRNAASWRIGAEMARRYPQDVVLIDSVPIGGVDYDCLSIVRLDGGGYIDFNRNSWGSAAGAVGDRSIGTTAFLLEWLSVPDRRRIIRRVSDWLEMPPVKTLPPTTRRVLSYRALAAFLQAHAMDRYRWSVDGAAVSLPDNIHRRTELIKLFPRLRIVQPVIEKPADLATDLAFSVWFICRNESPLAYVTAEARATNRKDVEVDLFDTYSRTKRIDDVVAQLASLMPR